MPEKTGELSPNQELPAKFKGLDDVKVAHSIITRDLFCSSADGENEVNQRIEEIAAEEVKNAAKFRIAKLYYEVKHDLDSALKKVDEISSQDERTRCLVHLAAAVLKNEGNPTLADQIVAKIKQDNQGYLKFYSEERERILAKQF